MPHHALEGEAVWLSASLKLDLSGIEFRLQVEAQSDPTDRGAELWIIGPPARISTIAGNLAEQSPALFFVADAGLLISIHVRRKDAENAAPKGQPVDPLPIVVIQATVLSVEATR